MPRRVRVGGSWVDVRRSVRLGGAWVPVDQEPPLEAVPLSIMDGLTPANPNVDDTESYTLGTVWIASVPGRVHGVRLFCPSTLPLGTPTGLLYRLDTDSAGVELARADFGALTPGAWCEALFAEPISVAANQPYVAAYWTQRGYVATSRGLSQPIVSGGLTAVPNEWAYPGVDLLRNGRYGQGSAPAFPVNAFNATNYFADVLWTPA
ncbi:DUF4082 domain-containing protein [Saccharothrix sp. HUAS TT1]|uniref:DUF4082 domain-containing protein n=1 Tax=unclassified Saccharothrix TaxID=2593673 RepID=UPI00345BB1EE